MYLDWILHPAAQCGLLAAGLLLCLFLFVSAKREIRVEKARGEARAQAAEAALSQIREELAQWESRLAEVEAKAGLLVPPAPAASGLNLSRRSQVLRMHRRGEAPEQIAASLGLPQNEVALLLKVHRLAADRV